MALQEIRQPISTTIHHPAYPPDPDETTRHAIELAPEFSRPDVAAHRLPLPEAVREVWERAVALGLPASDLALYNPAALELVTEELADNDGFCNPATGQVVLIDKGDEIALVRVLLHELAHLDDAPHTPTTIQGWYDAELRAVRATAVLARKLAVDDPGLPAALAAERRSLATNYRWLQGAAQAAGSARLPLASAVLSWHRSLAVLLDHSERRARSEIALHPGHRLWLLDIPRAMLRRHWAEGEADPLMALRPLLGDDDLADEVREAGKADEPPSLESTPSRHPNPEDDGLWTHIEAAEEAEATYWAIPPDHPIFAPGDDRDDGEIAEQPHEEEGFTFGQAWNSMVSNRRRASLLASLLGHVVALPSQPWTIISAGGEALAAAYVCVMGEEDLARGVAYLQSALLDQQVDGVAAAVWSLYTEGIDPTCDHAWYRLRVTFTGATNEGWPVAAEVWLFVWDDYPGFLVAALQSYIDGWYRKTRLCPVRWPTAPYDMPSLIIAGDTRLTEAMRGALGQWLDTTHRAAVADAKDAQ